jgi:hypothetical protein
MEDLRLKKGWFIQGGTGNIEDNYDFDEKKVGALLSLGTRSRNLRQSRQRDS